MSAGPAAPGGAPRDRGRRPPSRVRDAGLAVLLLALTAGLVWHQRLEKDEGYLTAGAWLVAGGRLPYHDFVFPQQPYFPLAYGALMRFSGPSLLAARALSAVLFLVLVVLVFVFLRRHARDERLARWGALFFCFNTLSLYWYPRARQYALADLLLFAGLLLVGETRRGAAGRRAVWACLLGGAAAAAAAQVRLVVAPAVAVLAIAAARAGGRRWSWRLGGAFCAGLVLGSAPFLWLLARDPRAWFDDAYVLQVLLRPPFEIGEMASQVRLGLAELVALPENVWLILALVVGLLPGGPPLAGGQRLALAMLVAVAGAALAVYPTQGQYLVEALPYLAVLAALGWGRMLGWIGRQASPVARLAPAGLLVALVAFGGGRAAWRILSDQHHDPALGMAGFLAYQEHMRRQPGPPGSVLLTWWPGYLLVEGVVPYPGAELGRPTERALRRLSEQGFAARGIRHPRQIEQDLRAGVPRFVVVGSSAPDGVAELLRGRYRERARFPGIAVHERREPDAEARASAGPR